VLYIKIIERGRKDENIQAIQAQGNLGRNGGHYINELCSGLPGGGGPGGQVVVAVRESRWAE